MATAISPGAGWSGATATPDAVGDSDATGYAETAIAGWVTVPFQQFASTFDVAVFAEHVEDISYVSFSVENGTWVNVANMARSSQYTPTSTVTTAMTAAGASDGSSHCDLLGKPLYLATLDADDFDDEQIEVRAIAYPINGVPFVLPSLYLNANAGGTLPQVIRYCDSVNGDDDNDGESTGTAVATIQKAIDKVNLAYNGSVAANGEVGGGIVKCLAGEYQYGNDVNAARSNSIEWLHIQPNDGVSRSSVVISSPGDTLSLYTEKVHLKNLTIDQSSNWIISGNAAQTDYLWIDDCEMVGPGRTVTGGGIGGTTVFSDCWITNTLWQHFRSGPAWNTINVAIKDIGEDAFNGQLVVNASAEDVDSADTIFHADFRQDTSTCSNRMAYGLIGELNLGQGIWRDAGGSGTTNGCYRDISLVLTNSYYVIQLTNVCKHMVFHRCALSGGTTLYRDDTGFDPTCIKFVDMTWTAPSAHDDIKYVSRSTVSLAETSGVVTATWEAWTGTGSSWTYKDLQRAADNGDGCPGDWTTVDSGAIVSGVNDIPSTSGTYWYRITGVDADGSTRYSEPVSVEVDVANFVYDTFTDTDSTALASHTGETGASWTLHTGGSGAPSITNNRVHSGDTSFAFVLASGTPPAADYVVDATMRRVTLVVDAQAGVLARFDDTNKTGYVACYLQVTGVWAIYRYVAGSGSLLASAAQSLSNDTDYVIEFSVITNGAAVDLELSIDGSSTVTYSDMHPSRVTSAGLCGVYLYKGTSSTGLHLADIAAHEPITISAPTVTTTAASSVHETSAVLGGEVTDDGGDTVTESGVVWNTTGDPTTSDNKVAIGTGTGSFSDTVTDLPAGTTIYYNAYATNSVGTSYGTADDFTTVAGDPYTTPAGTIAADGETLTLTWTRAGGWPEDMTGYNTAACTVTAGGRTILATTGADASVDGETLSVERTLASVVYAGETCTVEVEAGQAYSEADSETIRTEAVPEGTGLTNSSEVAIPVSPTALLVLDLL